MLLNLAILRRTMCPLLPIAVLCFGASFAHAELNDTGQTQCFDGTQMSACASPNAGNTSLYPRQDGRFGRDALTPGIAGFSFSKLCMDGSDCSAQVTGSTVANPAPSDWACTKDNATGLIWSLQTMQGDAAAASALVLANNAAERCNFATGWRLPTRQELLNIVHNGKSVAPLIDEIYFPATATEFYRSSVVLPSQATSTWAVDFATGVTGTLTTAQSSAVRLVHSAP